MRISDWIQTCALPILPPVGLAARQNDVAFEHAQFLVGKLDAVIGMNLIVDMRRGRGQRAFPQRARAVGFLPAAADLPIKAAIGFEETLVAKRLDQPPLALGARSEERRVGKGGVRWWRVRWSPDP